MTRVVVWFFVVSVVCPTWAQMPSKPWLYSTARAIPKETTSEGSGYFSIVAGKDAKLYIGTAKYRHNAFLVEYDPATQDMRTVVDAHREIGTKATGFAAQAKIHTRNNVGASGKIYFGTKQGYPNKDEKRTDYLGGYPMVFDPATGETRVYPIPIPHHGVISITPDESRGVAYISTCSDERPVESSHFMILDLATGKYRDLIETNHLYGFIVLDHLGRAYHPLRGGEIARYDPKTDKLERLKQTIDGHPPTAESHLADKDSHPINWEVSPNRKTLYAVAMSGNQLYGYDLTATGDSLPGKSLGKLCDEAEATDCRALCVSPSGTVWAGIEARLPKNRRFLQVISYRPGDTAPRDHGPIAIRNPEYTTFTGPKGEALPWHHGVFRYGDGNLLPRYTIMGICAPSDQTIFVTTLYPYTLHEIRIAPPKPAQSHSRRPVAGLTTVYWHNSHSDVLLGRMVQTETLDGRGRVPEIRLASLLIDQTPTKDTGRRIAAETGVRLAKSVEDALTLGTGKIAVEGVLLVNEHGEYPESPTGQLMFPKRRMFEQVIATLDKFGRRGLPLFCDKHLADNWTDAKFIYDEAKRREMPLMAGSCIPITWRNPPIDVRRGAKLKEIHVVSHHRPDIYGFHGLELMQALVERRAGGETGVAAVQAFVGDDVWKAAERGIYDRAVFDQTIAALRERPLPAGKRVEELAKSPLLFVIDYVDGLRGCLFTLEGALIEWAAAWKESSGQITSMTTVIQDVRPFMQFAAQFNAIERLVLLGESLWPAERTLLTSGVLDECLRSKVDGGQRRETPQLKFAYRCDWNWSQPIHPVPDRPLLGQ